MIRSLIVAIGLRNEIGKDNDLLWHLPVDMRFFKKTTTGHCIITGRKNYESIPVKYRPLVNRTNIVVTRNTNYQAEGAIVKNSLDSALDHAANLKEEEVFIIGGGQIYSQALKNGVVDKMYVTHVAKEYDADTFFPEIDFAQWSIVDRFSLESENLDAEVVVYSKK